MWKNNDHKTTSLGKRKRKINNSANKSKKVTVIEEANLNSIASHSSVSVGKRKRESSSYTNKSK